MKGETLVAVHTLEEIYQPIFLYRLIIHCNTYHICFIVTLYLMRCSSQFCFIRSSQFSFVLHVILIICFLGVFASNSIALSKTYDNLKLVELEPLIFSKGILKVIFTRPCYIHIGQKSHYPIALTMYYLHT